MTRRLAGDVSRNERAGVTIARRFHEEYEHIAPMYGWTTQEASRVDWDDLPDNQRKLMVHVVANLLAAGVILAPLPTADDVRGMLG